MRRGVYLRRRGREGMKSSSVGALAVPELWLRGDRRWRYFMEEQGSPAPAPVTVTSVSSSRDLVETLGDTRVRLSTVWKGLTLIATATALGYQYDSSLVKTRDLDTYKEALTAQVASRVDELRVELASVKRTLVELDRRERHHGQILSALQALVMPTVEYPSGQ